MCSLTMFPQVQPALILMYRELVEIILCFFQLQDFEKGKVMGRHLHWEKSFHTILPLHSHLHFSTKAKNEKFTNEKQ